MAANTGAPTRLAAGGKGEPPTGGQCELLNSSNATTGGTRNHEIRKPIRHSDHRSQGHTGINANGSHRIDRHAGPVLGSGAGCLRRCSHTRPCDCSVATVHCAGRREASTSNRRLSRWYGGRTSTVLSVDTSVPTGTGKRTSAARKSSLSSRCEIVASKRPTPSQAGRLARNCFAFISSPLPCCSFGSGLRNGGGGLGQFRPVFVPIIWPQLLARHRALGGKLNGQTSGGRNWTFAHLPLVHGGWCNF